VRAAPALKGTSIELQLCSFERAACRQHASRNTLAPLGLSARPAVDACDSVPLLVVCRRGKHIASTASQQRTGQGKNPSHRRHNQDDPTHLCHYKNDSAAAQHGLMNIEVQIDNLGRLS
jgi:hypothetical protein